MTVQVTIPNLVVRSIDATWNYARWERLPDDGNRYEVVDGVLYMSTAPSFFHQWVVRQTLLAQHERVDRPGLGTTIMAPIGLFMPGCDPVQPDVLVCSRPDATLGDFAQSQLVSPGEELV